MKATVKCLDGSTIEFDGTPEEFRAAFTSPWYTVSPCPATPCAPYPVPVAPWVRPQPAPYYEITCGAGGDGGGKCGR
jgi:hypothetical protein